MKPKADSLRRSNPSYTDFIKRESTNRQYPAWKRGCHTDLQTLKG